MKYLVVEVIKSCVYSVPLDAYAPMSIEEAIEFEAKHSADDMLDQLGSVTVKAGPSEAPVEPVVS